MGIVGKAVNSHLVRIPAFKTTLGNWLKQYPDSQILAWRVGSPAPCRSATGVGMKTSATTYRSSVDNFETKSLWNKDSGRCIIHLSVSMGR